MLSAIAARKAAQAAKLATVSQPTPSTSKNVDVSEHDSESEAERLKMVLQSKKSKRKSTEAQSAETSVAHKKQRKKSVKAEASQSRYYESAIVDDRGFKEVSSSSSSASDSDEDGQKVRSAQRNLEDAIQPQRPRKSRRAWSPSNPIPDSSSDELSYSTQDVLFPPEIAVESTSNAGCQIAQAPSFVPQPDKNVFYLDGCDHDFLPGHKGTVVSLVENESMALLGVYALTVLRGTVSLMGTDICASSSRSHTIFTPKCSPVPIIQVISPGGLKSSSLPDRIARIVGPRSAILLLEDLSTGIEDIGRVCKIVENTFESSSLGGNALNLSGAKLLSSIPRSLQSFQVPDSWRSTFASLPRFPPSEDAAQDMQSLEPFIMLVRGQKRTGKSTLARILANRLLNGYRYVAFLDCDVGQTEFSPPGLVSLHIIDRYVFGPPFTHPLLPYASHFIGAASPRNDPAHYLAAVSALLQTYKLELQFPAPEDEIYEPDTDNRRIADIVPLVVNTMGWMKGLGADLAKQIEEVVEPTHIFSIGSRPSSTGEAFVETMNPNGNVTDGNRFRSQTFEVEAISPSVQSARYSAADWRTLMFMSYFHSIPSPAQYKLLPTHTRPSRTIPSDPGATLCTWDFRLPLVAQAPYTVSVAEAIDNVILVGAGMEDVIPSELARVLNGAIVALVSCQPDFQEDPSRCAQQSRLPYTQGASPPDPSTSSCVGLALIRGVSPSLFDTPSQSENKASENDVLHVLTPLPPALIAATGARCFVKGEVELPVWGMLDYRELDRDGTRLQGTGAVPYLQWSKSDAIGAERRRVRRNIMRRGQM